MLATYIYIYLQKMVENNIFLIVFSLFIACSAAVSLRDLYKSIKNRRVKPFTQESGIKVLKKPKNPFGTALPRSEPPSQHHPTPSQYLPGPASPCQWVEWVNYGSGTKGRSAPKSRAKSIGKSVKKIGGHEPFMSRIGKNWKTCQKRKFAISNAERARYFCPKNGNFRT